MTKMWRFIALAVLLLGIAGIFRLYWVGFVWKNGLSNDTIVVLFVGLTAFLAVMIQIEEERTKRSGEQEGHKTALAKAITYEMDSFYSRHLDRDDRLKLFQRWEKMKADPSAVETFRSVAGNPFVVYQSSAGKLGIFDAGVTVGVIASYSACAAFLEVRELYERARDAGDKLLAENLQGVFRESAEDACRLASVTCQQLCRVARIDFSALVISKESQPHSIGRLGAGRDLQRAAKDNVALGKHAETH
jgi:hypothetical protein